MYYWINYARLFTCLSSLSVASVYDIKTREVPDKIWILSTPISAALTIMSLLYSSRIQEAVLQLIVVFTIMFTLSMVLFYLGLFGGADAKALIYLAVAMPEQLGLSSISPLFKFSMRLVVPPPISTLNNAVLIASLLIIYIILRNLVDLVKNKKIFSGLEHERFAVKICAFLMGYRVDIEKIRAGGHHYFIMEELSEREDGRIERKLKIFKRIYEDEDTSRVKVPVKFHGKIWVTPGLPFLVFITVGFVIAMFIGDIIFLLVDMILAF